MSLMFRVMQALKSETITDEIASIPDLLASVFRKVAKLTKHQNLVFQQYFGNSPYRRR